MNTIQYSPEAVRYMHRCFFGPIRVVDANGISIVSAVFAGLTRWQTDWQTDRPRYLDGNNRRSAQWRSQILLLSMATTSIYCSVCGETPQYSLEESVFHRHTRQVTQLFTYLLTHKLFSSCIRRYLVSRACDWVMPALSVVLLTFSFQFSLLLFRVGSQAVV